MPPVKIALVACRVLESEISALTRDATHIVRRELFEMGLHDQPTGLRERLMQAIGRAEADPMVEAVVLVYGLCGLALVGLTARRCPLVVARAHDCLTLFLGSKERYAECMRTEPGLYWYAPGWNRERRVPGPDREAKLRAEYTEKYGAEEAEALMEMERETFALHTCASYTDLRLPGDDEHRRYAEHCAEALGWRFAYHPGDNTLLRDLLYGPWDAERFLVVQPGQRIAHAVGAGIVRTEPAEPVPPPVSP
ncbi:MAG: DUF1638 domain-containing protein [Opitutaceae bacterium]